MSHHNETRDDDIITEEPHETPYLFDSYPIP